MLKPQKFRPLPTGDVPRNLITKAETEIGEYIAKKVFGDIIRILRKYFVPSSAKLHNSSRRLLEKIKNGDIVYRYNIFRGDVDTATAKELRSYGARYSRRVRGYVISAEDLPKDLVEAVAAFERRLASARAEILESLDTLDIDEITSMIPTDSVIRPVLDRAQDGLDKTLRAIQVEPDISPEMVDTIKAEWTENTQRYIKDFLAEETAALRQTIGANAWAGKRTSEVISELMGEYGITKRRAEFIARQETHLAMVALKKAGLERAQLPYYRWECVVGSPKHPVRPMHEALNGKIFRWDDPPITSPKGDRNHPGQDYNCRCTARPLFGFEDDYPLR